MKCYHHDNFVHSGVLLFVRNLYNVHCYLQRHDLTSARLLTVSSTPNQVPRLGGNIPLYHTTPGKTFEAPFTPTKTVLPGNNCRPNAKRFLSIYVWYLPSDEVIAKSKLVSSSDSRVISSVGHSRRNDLRSIPTTATLVKSVGYSASGTLSNSSPRKTCIGVDFVVRPSDNIFFSTERPTRSRRRIYLILRSSISCRGYRNDDFTFTVNKPCTDHNENGGTTPSFLGISLASFLRRIGMSYFKLYITSSPKRKVWSTIHTCLFLFLVIMVLCDPYLISISNEYF